MVAQIVRKLQDSEEDPASVADYRTSMKQAKTALVLQKADAVRTSLEVLGRIIKLRSK
jgi:hypothetical protein